MATKTEMHQWRRGGGVVAAVLLELLKVERFDTYGDLAEALKVRCATLRIPYDSGVISTAIEQVEASHGRLVTSRLPRRLVEREPEPSPALNPAQLATLFERLDIEVKTIDPPSRDAADAAHEAKVRLQAKVFQRCRPKRRPFLERLAEIFS
jgi:hypothetical protein